MTELERKIQRCVDDTYQLLDKKYSDGFNFFNETEMSDEKIRKEVLYEEMLPICMNNWIKEGEPYLTIEQFSAILEKIPIKYIIYSLKEKKIIESIEVNGSEQFYLSPKGIDIGLAMGLNKIN